MSFLQRGSSQGSLLLFPVQRGICEAGETCPVRQSALDRCLDKGRREKGKVEGHAHGPLAATLPRRDLMRILHLATEQLIQPLPCPCDSFNKPRPGFRSDRPRNTICLHTNDLTP